MSRVRSPRRRFGISFSTTSVGWCATGLVSTAPTSKSVSVLPRICSTVSLGLPGFKLVVSVHPEDEEYHRSQGENWFPEGLELDWPLHEYYTMRRAGDAT